LNNSTVEFTWYVRDASGNVMAVYNSTGTNNISSAGYTLNLAEQHLYGSSRLGVLNRNTSVKTAFVKPGIVTFSRGNKFFELSNHLQNVLVTVSDKKTPVDDGTYEYSTATGLYTKINSTPDGKVDFYTPDIVTANDYYPFGMMMPGRKYTATTSKYRYGFNGKENDNDVKGVEGGQQDYGLRIYDPRLGRFLSVDPLTDEYPWYSPYHFAGNSPIANIDLDGGEPKPATGGTQEGQTETTSEKKYAPSDCNCAESEGYTVSQNWHWHSGGLSTGRTEKGGAIITTQAGWYSAEDYVNVLKGTKAASQLASELNLYAYGIGSTTDRSELSKFSNSSPSINGKNFLIAAAKLGAQATNKSTSGKIDYSSFNVEDLIGVGLLFKQGAKAIDKYILKRLLQKSTSTTDLGLTTFQVSSLRISQTLESNAEMKVLRKLKSSVETNGFKYDMPFADQMHVFQKDGVNYLVNGHHRLAVAQKLGVKQVKVGVIDETYLMSRYGVTPNQLMKISDQANKIGNKIRW
jgi:RHS repeat-associated protein